jgi:hypothetical protein
VSNDDRWGFGQSADRGAPTPGAARDPAAPQGDFSFAGFDPLDDSGSLPATSALTIASPPARWLIFGAAASLVGGAVAALLGEMIVPAVVGWFLSGPVAIGLLAVFIRLDTERLARPTRALFGWVKPAYVACVVLALAAVCVSAVRIALWAGTR